MAVAADATATWDALRVALQRRRRELAAEISSYPSPIAGCDAQFNALLEERKQILQALRELSPVAPPADTSISDFMKRAQLERILT
jgi:hypothetical protein